MERLLIIEEGKERVFDINTRVVTLGRSTKNDITLKDRNASRRHCNIIQVGDSWFVVDCDSHNGTYVNEEKITKKELDDGDKIMVGAIEIYFLVAKEGEEFKMPDIKKEEAPVVENVKDIEDDDSSEEKLSPEEIEELELEEKPEPELIINLKETKKSELPEFSESLKSPAEILGKDPADIDIPTGRMVNSQQEIQKLKEFYPKYLNQMWLKQIGQEKAGKFLLSTLLAGGHALLYGSTTGGKVSILGRMAQLLGLSFQHIVGEYTNAVDIARQSNILLLENVSVEFVLSLCQRTPLNEKMNLYKRNSPYMIVVDSTNMENVGTKKLLQNSFFAPIVFAEFSPKQEGALLKIALQQPKQKPLLSGQYIHIWNKAIESVEIPDNIIEYVVRIIRATRPESENPFNLVKEYVATGASCVVGESILRLSRVNAALHGRSQVQSNDVQSSARYLIPYSLELTSAAQKVGKNVESIYSAILNKIEKPEK